MLAAVKILEDISIAVMRTFWIFSHSDAHWFRGVDEVLYKLTKSIRVQGNSA